MPRKQAQRSQPARICLRGEVRVDSPWVVDPYQIDVIGESGKSFRCRTRTKAKLVRHGWVARGFVFLVPKDCVTFHVKDTYGHAISTTRRHPVCRRPVPCQARYRCASRHHVGRRATPWCSGMSDSASCDECWVKEEKRKGSRRAA